jgi:lycopene beta-cyclase
MYVVPYSPTSALVEDTTIGPQGVASAERRDEVRRYLEERYGLTDWRVVREEESVIPMLGVRQARRAAARVIPVGTAAGAVRPSSGYTFIRTQRQVAAIADRVGRGQPAAVAVGRFRDAFLDRVFLEVLEADPAGFYPNLVMLGRRLSGDRFARFMMDAAGPVDMFCMIAALPKLPFLAGAARVGREAVRR